MKRKVLWRVDLQNDFMNKDGKLYVPDAESIKTNVKDLTNYGRDKKIFLYGSVDAHTEDDSEFKLFPEHCVIGTYGQKEINEVNSQALYISSNKEHNLNELNGLEEIIFEKQHPDVFTNINADSLVKKLVGTAVVYGVATDICVFAAVKGLRERGVKVYVVEDAIKGLDKSELTIKQMEKLGAKLTKAKKITNGEII